MPYLELMAAPVLADASFKGKPLYTSFLVVRASSTVAKLDDLAGATLAYNDVESLSGYHIARYWLHSHGKNGSFFSKTFGTGGHLKSLHAIATGAADVCAVDVGVWHEFIATQPDAAAQLKVLSGPDFKLPHVPIQPFVAAKALPEKVKAGLREAFAAVGRSTTPPPASPTATAAASGAGAGAGSAGTTTATSTGTTGTATAAPKQPSASASLAAAARHALHIAKFVPVTEDMYSKVSGMLLEANDVQFR